MLALLAASAALAPQPTYTRRAMLAATVGLSMPPRSAVADGGFFGYEDGKDMQLQNAAPDTSPLIEELKRRTEANKAQNAAIVAGSSAGAQGGLYDDPNVKLVRYQGQDDLVPVTRIMGAQQVKQLEAKGFALKCPKWGGACEIEQRRR